MASRSRLRLRGSLRNPRLRTSLWVALSIIALAAVVFAASALSSPRDAVPRLPSASTNLTPAEQSQRDYAAAQAALASGDKKKAAGLLEKAVKEDPSNTSARDKLTELQKSGDVLDPARQAPPSKTETSPAGNPPGNNPPPNNPPSGAKWYDSPVTDIGKLLPAGVSGFTAGTKLVQGPEGQLALDPATSQNTTYVRRVLLSVHDRGSAAKASEFVSTQLKLAYPKAHADVDAAGTKATFGSDGNHYGAVLFARGRFAYEVVMTSSRPDPATLKSLGDQIADAFPTKP